jgi:hypothetical protein
MDISAPASISSRPEFATKTGETGDIVIKYTEPDGYVTYRRDVTATDSSGKQSGYTIVYDPQDDSFVYEYSTGDADKAPTAGVSVISSKTRPGEKTPTVDVRAGQKVTDVAAAAKPTPTAPTRPTTTAPAGGMAGEGGGGATMPTPAEEGGMEVPERGMGAGGEMAGEGVTTRPVEDMTGSELLGDALAGAEGGLGGGEGAGEGAGGGEGEGELAAQPTDLDELTDQDLLDLLEDSMAEDTPLIPPDDTGVTGGLDVRTASVGKPRGVQSSISPRVVGTSPTAAIVGQKEPIFGGEENAQSDLWNTRSLRLRKALGL